MAIELKGLARVLSKLDNLEKVDGKAILEEVAKDTSEAIQKEAKKVSDTAYQYAGEVEVRTYGLSCFIDVGFSSDKVPFEQWKPLWFQHWGFKDYGLNFSGQYFIANHQGWFEDAVNKHEAKAIRKIKDKAKKKLKEAWKC